MYVNKHTQAHSTHALYSITYARVHLYALYTIT